MNDIIYRDDCININVKNLFDFTKIDRWVFSYGGCGTNYMRKLLLLWGKKNISKIIGYIHTKRTDCNFQTFKLATIYLKQEFFLKQSTHICTPPTIHQPFVAIYIFGDPYLSLQSLFRHNRFVVANILAGKQLYINKNMNLKEYICNGRDDLRLIEHFNNWYDAKTKYKIIFIHYDKLKDNFDEVETFLTKHYNKRIHLGVKKNLRTRKSTLSKFTSEELEQLDKIYGDFRKHILELPAYWVKEPE